MDSDDNQNVEIESEIIHLIKKRRNFFTISLIVNIIITLFVCYFCISAILSPSSAGLAFAISIPLWGGLVIIALALAIRSLVLRCRLKKIMPHNDYKKINGISLSSIIIGFVPFCVVTIFLGILSIPPKIRQNQICAEYHEFDNIQKTDIVLIGYNFDEQKEKYLIDHQGKLKNEIIRSPLDLKKELGKVIDDSSLFDKVDFVNYNYLIKMNTYTYPSRKDLLLQSIITKINFHERENETIVFDDYDTSVLDENHGTVKQVKGWTVYLVPISKEYSDESINVRVEDGIHYAGCKSH